MERVYRQRDALAPNAARRLVDEVASIHPQARSDLILAVSELVANAVRHAPIVEGGHLRLVLEADAEGVLVEVHDPGNGFDPTPAPGTSGGRGLKIVAAVADKWGIESPGHTLVWCRIPFRRAEGRALPG